MSTKGSFPPVMDVVPRTLTPVSAAMRSPVPEVTLTPGKRPARFSKGDSIYPRLKRSSLKFKPGANRITLRVVSFRVTGFVFCACVVAATAIMQSNTESRRLFIIVAGRKVGVTI